MAGAGAPSISWLSSSHQTAAMAMPRPATRFLDLAGSDGSHTSGEALPSSGQRALIAPEFLRHCGHLANPPLRFKSVCSAK